jgi:hypothetical protein
MCISFDELTHEQQSTVRAIFEDLPRSDIAWANVFDLFKALGILRSIDGFVCVEVQCRQEIRRGVFPCSNEQDCVSRHMIGYLRHYLRGLGVEPN